LQRALEASRKPLDIVILQNPDQEVIFLSEHGLLLDPADRAKLERLAHKGGIWIKYQPSQPELVEFVPAGTLYSQQMVRRALLDEKSKESASSWPKPIAKRDTIHDNGSVIRLREDGSLVVVIEAKLLKPLVVHS
jgi:hypothetical protein